MNISPWDSPVAITTSTVLEVDGVPVIRTSVSSPPFLEYTILLPYSETSLVFDAPESLQISPVVEAVPGFSTTIVRGSKNIGSGSGSAPQISSFPKYILTTSSVPTYAAFIFKLVSISSAGAGAPPCIFDA